MMLHRSPGITAIYNEVKKSRRNRILDLGAMSASSFQFFSSLSCKIHFENLDEFILECGSISGPDLVNRLEKYLLSHNAEEKFDVILTWDIFNYLPLSAVQALLRNLSAYCKHNTLLHSVRYLGSKVPTAPAQFSIKDQYHVEIRFDATKKREIERYSTADFLKWNPEFFLHNNIMNEKGMVRGVGEEVIRFMPDRVERKQYISQTEMLVRRETPGYRAVGADIKRVVDQEGPKYYSPSMRTLFSPENRRAYRLLDLGSKNNVNMEIWRNHFSEVYTEDLFSSLQWRQAHTRSGEGFEGGSPLSPEALSFAERKFDVIIFWDILNFCTKEQISAVAERLDQYCHASTQIVAFTYSGVEIPVKPQRFLLTVEGDLHINEVSKQPRQVETITTAGIMKLAKTWKVRKTHVFQPGMKSGVAELYFDYSPPSASSMGYYPGRAEAEG